MKYMWKVNPSLLTLQRAPIHVLDMANVRNLAQHHLSLANAKADMQALIAPSQAVQEAAARAAASAHVKAMSASAIQADTV